MGMLIAGCSESPAPATAEADLEAPRQITDTQRTALETRMDGPPTTVHITRGVIVSLPNGSTPLSIRHEAIDDFVGIDGTVVGMDAMTMDFPLAVDELIDGFKAGDKVRVTLEVWWGSKKGYFATALERLDPETELVFGKAVPPQG